MLVIGYSKVENILIVFVVFLPHREEFRNHALFKAILSRFGYN